MNDTLVHSFDGLASRIDAGGARTVGFTGALLGEGVSTIAIGTALALAALRPEKVLLVDANWIHPSLSADAGLESAPGLADHLAGKADLASVIRPAAREGLAFVPVGNRSVFRPTLRSVAAFLANGVPGFETVLVDLPPVLAGESYVLPWATLLDHVFVVVREAATPLPMVRLALTKIGLATPQVVLNRTAGDDSELPKALIAPHRARA
jgi:tyrosine-protein kinase Etk/Wzc